MTKFPFTPDGAAAMCQHYFNLPSEQLQVAAAELGQNFTLWVQNNFDLEESQVKYLTNIAPQVTAFMAANASFALANRLPIILAKEGEPTEPLDSKLTNPKAKLAANILPNGQFTAQGEFVIEITY